MSEQHNHQHYPGVQIIIINEDVLKAKPGEISRIINEANGGPVYIPPQVVTEDAWGTKLEFAEMPELYDNGNVNGGYTMRQYVSGMSMLCMRMRWGPYCDDPGKIGAATAIPFDHLAVHKAKEKIIIFIVKNGEPITLEDQKELFPSDELVTKLRLLTQDEPTTHVGMDFAANARL